MNCVIAREWVDFPAVEAFYVRGGGWIGSLNQKYRTCKTKSLFKVKLIDVYIGRIVYKGKY